MGLSWRKARLYVTDLSCAIISLSPVGGAGKGWDFRENTGLIPATSIVGVVTDIRRYRIFQLDNPGNPVGRYLWVHLDPP